MQSMLDLYYTRVREVALGQVLNERDDEVARILPHDDRYEVEQPRAA